MNKFLKGLISGTNAPSSSGEFVLPQELIPMPMTDASNVIGVISGAAKRLVEGFKRVIKDKKQLIPALVLGGIWVVLTLLPSLGINPLSVKILSWLTFARGGLGGNILNKIAGIVGKGLFASLLTKLITDKSTLGNIKAGFSSLTNSIKGEKAINPVWLFGVGIALIAYNLMVTHTTLQNTMAGVACFALSLRSMVLGKGVVLRLFTSIISKIKPASSVEINRLMTGWTSGFALGVVISLIPVSFGGYLFGAAAIIAATIMVFVKKPKQEVA